MLSTEDANSWIWDHLQAKQIYHWAMAPLHMQRCAPWKWGTKLKWYMTAGITHFNIRWNDVIATDAVATDSIPYTQIHKLSLHMYHCRLKITNSCPHLLLNFSGCFSRMMWNLWAIEASWKKIFKNKYYILENHKIWRVIAKLSSASIFRWPNERNILTS